MPRKIINVGRVKGSMWYSGENFQEDIVNIKPLEGDFYLDTYTSLVHVYDGSQWRELINLTEYFTDGIISSTDNIVAADVIDIATAETYDEASETQVPTSKAISDYIKKLRYETIIKEVRVITSLEKIYNTYNELSKVTDQPEGTIFVCKTDRKLPYVLYRWDLDTQTWIYVDDVREGTIYYLEKDSGGFKAYTVLCFVGTEFKQLSANDDEIKKLIPTKVSELTNDSGYIKNTVDNLTNYYLKNETYTKNEVLELIGQISTMSLEVVTDLPTENISLTTIYLKLSGNEEMNIYEEYIYVNGQWETIGTTKVDLSNYVQKNSNAELDKINATRITVNSHPVALENQLFSKNYYDLTNRPTIPTFISQLTNDSGYIKNTASNLTNYYLKNETYTKTEIQSLINSISTLTITVVSSLPINDISTTTIYLVPINSEDNHNIYEEYIYVNGQWEMIGTTKVDLSNYVQTEQVMEIVEENSDEVETLLIGTSENYDVESDDQVPTTKAVKQIVDEKLGDIQTLLEAI